MNNNKTDDKSDKNWEKIKHSYASASTFPVKMMLHNGLIRHIGKQNKIPMTHLQINPTNNCNRNCTFCSFSNRDKELELSHRKIINIMKKAKKCGCESLTITGGGEPLMHKKINEIISDIHDMGIEMGLVTNGDMFRKLNTDAMNLLTWCRISVSDYGPFDNGYIENIKKAVKRGPNVD